jgi:hypothetical protein
MATPTTCTTATRIEGRWALMPDGMAAFGYGLTPVLETTGRRHYVKRRVLAAALIVTVAGCTSGLNRPVREVTAAMGSDNIQRVKITTHSFYFDPNRIVVKRGIPVQLTVKNGALLVPHDFSCEAKEAGIELDQKVGMFHGSKTVRFTPDRIGEYPFIATSTGMRRRA